MPDDGNDKVHKDYVPKEDNEQPNEPGKFLEVRTINKLVRVTICNGFPQDHQEVANIVNLLISRRHLLHYDSKSDRESTDDNEKEKQEIAEVLNHGFKHLH